MDYVCSRPAAGGDLFLTEFGLPLAAWLQPENWFDRKWFEAHRRRLRGTSIIYHIPTKPVRGRTLELVARFSRMAEDLPVDTITRDEHSDAAFNSPFEEVAELLTLRAARIGPERRRILTKRPLAIYSPPRRLELWQTGRSETVMAVKQARLQGGTLDINRQYLLIYGWIKGVDLMEAAEQLLIGRDAREALKGAAMREVEADLAQAGFRVVDMKLAHIIVRFTADGRLRRRRDGRLSYALVDYELLERI